MFRLDIMFYVVQKSYSQESFAHALVAQLDRVFGYEPKGRGFEPLRAHHENIIHAELAEWQTR